MQGKKVSQSVTQFPTIRMSNVGIRMFPKKMLVSRDQELSPILSKNLRKEVVLRLVFPHSDVAHVSFQAVRFVAYDVCIQGRRASFCGGSSQNQEKDCQCSSTHLPQRRISISRKRTGTRGQRSRTSGPFEKGESFALRPFSCRCSGLVSCRCALMTEGLIMTS